MSNTAGTTFGAGFAYHSGVPDIDTKLNEVRVAKSLAFLFGVFYYMYYLPVCLFLL